jgi:hypothetical protein
VNEDGKGAMRAMQVAAGCGILLKDDKVKDMKRHYIC